MAKIKSTQKSLDGLINQLSVMKARRDHVLKLDKAKNRSEWSHLKGLLEDMASMHKRAIENLVEEGESLGDSERVKLLEKSKAQRDSFEWVINLVETPESELKKVEEYVKDLEQQIVQKRSDLVAFGPEE